MLYKLHNLILNYILLNNLVIHLFKSIIIIQNKSKMILFMVTLIAFIYFQDFNFIYSF